MHYITPRTFIIQVAGNPNNNPNAKGTTPYYYYKNTALLHITSTKHLEVLEPEPIIIQVAGNPNT